MTDTTGVLGASIPNDRWIEIATAAVVLVGLRLFLRRTRYGLIVRAGVENRAMVTALGIDVRRAFTLVFAIGGLAAALAGVLASLYFGTVDPQLGTRLLIYAFIVVVIGGLGSITGTALAAVLVALVQQYANYYASSGIGDLSVTLLLALVLLVRPGGLAATAPRMSFSRTQIRNAAIPLVLLVVLALVPKLAIDIPYLFGGGLDTPGNAAAARADADLRRARADLRRDVRLHRPALVRARAVLRRRRLRRRDRGHEVALELLGGGRADGRGRARAAAARRLRLPARRAGSRSRW